jgi:hypothetical protein
MRVRLNETRFGPEKSRSRYISALKKVVPDISRPKKSRHYFDALNISLKPECVLSFNMDWRILVNCIPRFWLAGDTNLKFLKEIDLYSKI